MTRIIATVSTVAALLIAPSPALLTHLDLGDIPIVGPVVGGALGDDPVGGGSPVGDDPGTGDPVGGGSGSVPTGGGTSGSAPSSGTSGSAPSSGTVAPTPVVDPGSVPTTLSGVPTVSGIPAGSGTSSRSGASAGSTVISPPTRTAHGSSPIRALEPENRTRSTTRATSPASAHAATTSASTPAPLLTAAPGTTLHFTPEPVSSRSRIAAGSWSEPGAPGEDGALLVLLCVTGAGIVALTARGLRMRAQTR